MDVEHVHLQRLPRLAVLRHPPERDDDRVEARADRARERAEAELRVPRRAERLADADAHAARAAVRRCARRLLDAQATQHREMNDKMDRLLGALEARSS